MGASSLRASRRAPHPHPPLKGRDSGQRHEDGFTLAEVLAALAVFSIAALALLHLSAENARAAGAARDHAFAAIVAENVMVETMAAVVPPRVGRETGEESLVGRGWRWTRTVSETGEPGMVRVDIEVTAGETDFVVAALSGFRSAP